MPFIHTGTTRNPTEPSTLERAQSTTYFTINVKATPSTSTYILTFVFLAHWVVPQTWLLTTSDIARLVAPAILIVSLDHCKNQNRHTHGWSNEALAQVCIRGWYNTKITQTFVFVNQLTREFSYTIFHQTISLPYVVIRPNFRNWRPRNLRRDGRLS